MTTISEIDNKIDQLNEQFKNVKGTKSEVYARIVGYYRSVANWNRGKSEEYGERVNFSDLETRKIEKPYTPEAVKVETEAIEINFEEKKCEFISEATSYNFFYKESCPNCPPVKAIIDSIVLEGNQINVDNSEGLTEAMNSSVYSAPTVILYNEDKTEIYRTSNAEKLKSFLKVKTA